MTQDGSHGKICTLFLFKIHSPCLSFKEGEHPPPIHATILVTWLLPKDDSLITLGNLVEEYQEIAKALGNKVARHWYWPYVKNGLWWFAKKVGTLAGLGEMFRRFMS